MNKIRKYIQSGALILALSSCALPEKEYLEGRIVKESGTVINIVKSSGSLFGNESVKFENQNYVLTVETEQGKYIINVRDSHSKPISALAEAIEEGDKIKFPIKKPAHSDIFNAEYNYFSKDRIGTMHSIEIEVLGK